MCTLVVAAHAVPGFPLVVVANRDEMLDRPSSPPFRWGGGFVAPRDEVAGGTWLGLNDHGVFVGITNRYLGPNDASRASRGALVVRALAGESASAIHEALGRTDPAAYNGFHLIYADRQRVLATVSDGRSLAQLELGAGLSIVTERSFGAGDDAPRTARIRAVWMRAARAPFDPLAATGLLTEHDAADPFRGTCVHVLGVPYGTRSAMVLAVAESGDRQMLWAEGPPCRTPFERVPEDRSPSSGVSIP